jgi:hypothetical protein
MQQILRAASGRRISHNPVVTLSIARLPDSASA